MSSASAGWERPEISSRRRRGMSSTGPTLLRRSRPPPSLPPPSGPPGSFERPVRRHHRARAPPRPRARARCRDRPVRRRRWPPGCRRSRVRPPVPRPRVGQHGVGADLAPLRRWCRRPAGSPRGAARRRSPGCDLGVDVGPLGVPHGHAPAHPALVDAVAQLGLGHGQLGPVVDPGRLHGVGQDERLHACSRRCSARPRRRSGSTRPGRWRG